MDQGLPSFSIIVPTHNRPHQLSNICLPALAQLDYPAHLFEVIVVDDGSQAFLDGVVKEFSDRLNVRLLRQDHSGPAAARNRGARLANGRFLAFTDDDCAPVDNWLSALAHRLQEQADCAVGGYTANALVQNPYSAACQLLVDYLYDHPKRESSTARFFTSNNLAVPADHFQSVGGFNEVFSIGGEDREFCYRWTQRGFRLTYAAEALVYHWHRMSFQSFVRQHFRYGVGAFIFRKIIAEIGRKPMKIERPSFYYGLLQYAWSRENQHSKLSRVALLGCSQLAISVGYFWKWLSRSSA